MSHWKVILAALVIFAAGLVVGGVGTRWLLRSVPPPAPPPVERPPLPFTISEEFVRRMAEEVGLSREQRPRITKLIRASQARIGELYSLVGPAVTEELQGVREAIRAELTPEQQPRFEQFLQKQRTRRWGDKARPEGQRPRYLGPGGPESDGRRAPFRKPSREPAPGPAPP